MRLARDPHITPFIPCNIPKRLPTPLANIPCKLSASLHTVVYCCNEYLPSGINPVLRLVLLVFVGSPNLSTALSLEDEIIVQHLVQYFLCRMKMAMSVLYSACVTPRTQGGCGVETSRICVCACMYGSLRWSQGHWLFNSMSSCVHVSSPVEGLGLDWT